MSAPPPLRIAVIGAGVTGLAAAHRVGELSPRAEVRLFERSDRVGGVLQTESRDGFLIERSADNFLTKTPHATALCERIGLADELIPTESARRRAMVVRRGRLLGIPEGFVIMSPGAVWPIVATGILSPAGKARLMCEPLVPPRRDASDESVADFCRRRLGSEAFTRLVQPLVGGIYTADPERLSMAATMPHLLQDEREHGGLWRAARGRKRQQSSGARYNLFMAPRGGMQAITDRLRQRLPAGCLFTGSDIRALHRDRSTGKWRIEGSEGGDFDAVIVAAPAPAAGEMLAGLDASLASELRQIEYAGATIVCLGYERRLAARPMDGFGFVVPHAERRPILAASFASHKFPGRAPQDCELVRVFFGGALQPEMADRPDAELIQIAREQLGELIGLSGEPKTVEVARWGGAMPQYHVGHVERVDRILQHAAAWPGLYLAGAAYRGVGVPNCIASGEAAAEAACTQR
ncbi:Protoporphyrinogen oxidase [Pirellulimonas nuda]|uniref:Coproporphyrinogen III oxidase n=1 Tax=Pirellulimonas nuda TaxID=2528009 RepID=A0A518DBC3_9BACT|nr:protoporphyrinogen oxidase [Pirellulimonas nuda]QDU88781.1 Protoporphyrinogen oxidase [Pirellulimonas nuda]